MRFLELVKYKNLATKDERILSTPKSIDPKNNWVYIYENGNVYKTGSYVEYNGDIYYVIRCPDIYKGKVTDDCYWYYGQDYEIYQMDNDKLVDTLGYEVNGIDVYDISKLDIVGSLGVGSYYYANKAIYRIISGTYTYDTGKSSDFESEKVAIRIGGIYAFYSFAFSKFESGMYIIDGDYVYLTYTDVESPFSFSDRSRFEVVGVAHRDYRTCKPNLEYILFSFYLSVFFMQTAAFAAACFCFPSYDNTFLPYETVKIYVHYISSSDLGQLIKDLFGQRADSGKIHIWDVHAFHLEMGIPCRAKGFDGSAKEDFKFLLK